MEKTASILIIDDDEMFCRLLCGAFQADGQVVVCAHTLKDGLYLATSRPFDVVFLDVRMPDGNGLDILAQIRDVDSRPEVIILTGAGSANGAELAIKSGAWDYIRKPSSISAMKLPLMRALQYRREKLKKQPAGHLKLDGIIGRSARMKACFDLVAEAASCDASVLITGETGSGKELFARAIHDNSRRGSRHFVIVDCAALTQNLTESALFGYEKGAFTGAERSREGLIKRAHGGTLFLDEIGELPLALQKSFLRVLQEKSFRPLGSDHEVESDFRLLAATNRNLDALAAAGQFRQDLLFRIRSITLEAPPLREHIDDLLQIAVHHIDKICRRSRLEQKTMSPDFQEALLSYAWPGNIRELVNAVERAIAAAHDTPTLFARHLPSAIRVQLAKLGAENTPFDDRPDQAFRPIHFPTIKDFRAASYAQLEEKYLQDLIKHTQDFEQARLISGLSRTRFYDLLRRHQIVWPTN